MVLSWSVRPRCPDPPCLRPRILLRPTVRARIVNYGPRTDFPHSAISRFGFRIAPQALRRSAHLSVAIGVSTQAWGRLRRHAYNGRASLHQVLDFLQQLRRHRLHLREHQQTITHPIWKGNFAVIHRRAGDESPGSASVEVVSPTIGKLS